MACRDPSKRRRAPVLVIVLALFLSVWVSVLADQVEEARGLVRALASVGGVAGHEGQVRAIDSSNITDPAMMERVLTLAQQAGLPVQYGLTRGGNDGSVFPELGTPDLALSWPTVHSHSPVEVIHEKDLDGLGALVRLVAERW